MAEKKKSGPLDRRKKMNSCKKNTEGKKQITQHSLWDIKKEFSVKLFSTFCKERELGRALHSHFWQSHTYPFPTQTLASYPPPRMENTHAARLPGPSVLPPKFHLVVCEETASLFLMVHRANVRDKSTSRQEFYSEFTRSYIKWLKHIYVHVLSFHWTGKCKVAIKGWCHLTGGLEYYILLFP